jgi:hypothetical protein
MATRYQILSTKDLGANVATFLATPSSANLAAALTDETGSGAAVFGTSPTFTTGITTPSILSAASLGITPAAGNNLNVTLSGAGDLAVNTDVLYVDSSTGNVGVGTAIPAVKHQVVGVSRYGDQATNYATFAADGELTLVGTARVNRTIPLGIDGLAAGGVAPSIVRVVNFYGYEFSINDAGYVKGFELPYDWDSTTAISFKFHWACNNSSASKFIQWQLDYTSVAENTENINAATSTLPTGDLAVSTTPYRLTETSISIAAAGLALDDVIGMQVKRIAASGGAGVVPDNEPIIIGLEIEFVSNKLGEAT